MSKDIAEIHPTDAHVGRAVREYRLIKGITQQQLATAIDVSFQQVQKYEKGLNRFSASRLHATALALGVPVAAFFEGLDEENDWFFPVDEIALLNEIRRKRSDIKPMLMDLLSHVR